MINTIKKSANKNYTDVTEKWINASLKIGKVKIAQCYIYNNIKYVVDGKYIILTKFSTTLSNVDAKNEI